jgi:hypothetical protein
LVSQLHAKSATETHQEFYEFKEQSKPFRRAPSTVAVPKIVDARFTVQPNHPNIRQGRCKRVKLRSETR